MSLENNSQVYKVQFKSDSVVGISVLRKIGFRDVESERVQGQLQFASSCLDFKVIEEHTVVSGHIDGSLFVSDLRQPEFPVVSVFQSRREVDRVDVSLDGTLVLCKSGPTISLLDMRVLSSGMPLSGDDSGILFKKTMFQTGGSSIGLFPSGSAIAYIMTNTLNILDLATNETFLIQNQEQQHVWNYMCISEDCKIAVSSNSSSKLTVITKQPPNSQ